MLCLLYPAASLAAGLDSVLTFAAFEQSRQSVSGKTRRLKRISCKSHMCIRSWLKACIFTKRKEKGGVYMEIKRGRKSQWRKCEQALLLLPESNTRETTLAKANPRSQSAGRDWGVAGLHLSSHPIASLPRKDAHLPYVPALPLLLRLAGHPGRRVLEGSLQTWGLFSHCRAPPRCPSCSWMWSSSLS